MVRQLRLGGSLSRTARPIVLIVATASAATFENVFREGRHRRGKLS